MKKKTFVMHEDWANYILNLPKEMAGELSQMIMAYALNGELVETDNPAIQAMFKVIKDKIDDDYMKWLDRCDRNRRNRLGIDDEDDVDNEEEQMVTSGDDSLQVVTNGNDSDYDYHNHIHNHKSSTKTDVKTTETDIEIIDYFNTVCNTKYGYKNKQILEMIHGRLSDGFSVDNFKEVIDKKHGDWINDPKMIKFLKPTTLFRPSHFEEYLNQKTRGDPRTRSEMIDEQMKDW